jgi:DNA (cytosine-5)-methyltransferase 1
VSLRYLSLCSGIEAAAQAWHPLGWQPVAFSEIEPFPCAVLAHHYPSVPNWGDMTRFQEWPDAVVDVLVGGTPCQSFSVAGLRAGLADPRGNLMLTYLAIAERYRPRWIVWENVPGVLSSSMGRDFGTFLGGLGQLGYGFAYRVLDAQYVRTCGHPWAVPQRRRRVFVVGYLGDWRRAAAVLIDREGLRGDSPPRRKAGQAVAHTIASRPTGGGGLGTDFDCDGGLIHCPPVVPQAMSSKWSKGSSGPAGDEVANLVAHAVAPPITHNPYGDHESRDGLLVAHTLSGNGFNASGDGTGRGTPLVPVAIQERAICESPNAGPDGAGVRQDGAAHALEARTVPQAVAFDLNQITSKTNRSRPDPAVHHTPPASATPPLLAQPVAFARQAGGKQTTLGVRADGACQTIGANQTPAVDFDLRGREGGAMPEGPHETAALRAASGGSSRSYLASPWTVRRLTPRECERLQGFPDDFTRIPYRGKPADLCPDSPRYKALGNSMAVNVMEWIGERIAEVEAVA